MLTGAVRHTQDCAEIESLFGNQHTGGVAREEREEEGEWGTEVIVKRLAPAKMPAQVTSPGGELAGLAHVDSACQLLNGEWHGRDCLSGATCPGYRNNVASGCSAGIPCAAR